MYIDVVPNRNSPPAILLRHSYREGGKVKKKTLANLTDWPPEVVDALKRILKGAVAINHHDLFTIESSLAQGHVAAVLGTIKNIKLDYIISSKPCRESKLVLAMIIEQIINPTSKLGCIRLLPTTTLSKDLQIGDADENELYHAMDWLFERKDKIEKKLSALHLSEGAHALYDITSSYYEGHTSSLAQFGYNRDKKKGKKIIVYGVLTNAAGCPVAVEVYPGKTKDSITVPDQADKLRNRFGLEKIIMVGDRGMFTQTQIDNVKQYPGIGWITAMGYSAVKKLADECSLQLSLFDEQNIAEITSESYPGERLVACYNPLVAEKRNKSRASLLQATEKDLDKIVHEVARRKKKKLSAKEISIKVGKVINKHKMGKHFKLNIQESSFSYQRDESSIRQESDLDGIYVIRTSEPQDKLSTEDTVRSYKNLSKVEQLFRTMKGMEILVRPIRHRIDERIISHIFICMLAYYVEWHMRKVLAPLLFDDEQLDEDRKTRDAVTPASPSQSAKKKKQTRKTDEGLPVQSFRTLLANLGTRTLNRCNFQDIKSKEKSVLYKLTELTPLQRKTYELLNVRTQ